MALDLTSATNVGFLMALPVVFTPVIAAVVLRRRYRLVHLPFQAAVVGGLYLLCSSGGTFSFGPGEALALLCAVTGAGAYVFGERGMAHMDVTAMSFAQIAVTFVVSLAGTFAFDGPLDVAAVQPEAWGVVAFLALASTCLAFALQNAALVCLPSSTVSMLLASEPIFTALFSWGILGETLSLVGLAGGCRHHRMRGGGDPGGRPGAPSRTPDASRPRRGASGPAFRPQGAQRELEVRVVAFRLAKRGQRAGESVAGESEVRPAGPLSAAVGSEAWPLGSVDRGCLAG